MSLTPLSFHAKRCAGEFQERIAVQKQLSFFPRDANNMFYYENNDLAPPR